MTRVYLAGPDVFRRDPLAIRDELKQACRENGLEGVFPLDGDLRLQGDDPKGHGHQISKANEALIRGCDAVLANLTPFRGPSADPGTAFEVGFARALGKPIVGYTFERGLLFERVQAWSRLLGGDIRGSATEGFEDHQGDKIEPFGLPDNLMLPGAIEASGGTIVVPTASGEGEGQVRRRAVEELAKRLEGPAMPESIKTYERLDQACRYEKDWINQRLGWLFSSQSILFAAYGLALRVGTPESKELTERFLRLLPWLGIAIAVATALAVVAAVFAYYFWSKMLFSHTYEDHDKLPFLRTRPIWPRLASATAAALVPIIFGFAWLALALGWLDGP